MPAQAPPGVAGRPVTVHAAGQHGAFGEQDRIVAAIRAEHARGAINVACGLLAGFTGGPEKSRRIEALELIDQNAAIRGYLSDGDKRMRALIWASCVKDLGFDPLRLGAASDDPQAAPTVIETRAFAPTMVKALPPPLAPLIGGDWAELGRRVALGLLSQSDAMMIGEIWVGHGGRA